MLTLSAEIYSFIVSALTRLKLFIRLFKREDIHKFCILLSAEHVQCQLVRAFLILQYIKFQVDSLIIS